MYMQEQIMGTAFQSFENKFKYFPCFILNLYLYIQRERGKEEGREGRKQRKEREERSKQESVPGYNPQSLAALLPSLSDTLPSRLYHLKFPEPSLIIPLTRVKIFQYMKLWRHCLFKSHQMLYYILKGHYQLLILLITCKHKAKRLFLAVNLFQKGDFYFIITSFLMLKFHMLGTVSLSYPYRTYKNYLQGLQNLFKAPWISKLACYISCASFLFYMLQKLIGNFFVLRFNIERSLFTYMFVTFQFRATDFVQLLNSYQITREACKVADT